LIDFAASVLSIRMVAGYCDGAERKTLLVAEARFEPTDLSNVTGSLLGRQDAHITADPFGNLFLICGRYSAEIALLS